MTLAHVPRQVSIQPHKMLGVVGEHSTVRGRSGGDAPFAFSTAKCLLKEKSIRQHLNGPRMAHPTTAGEFFLGRSESPPRRSLSEVTPSLDSIESTFQTAGLLYGGFVWA